MKSSSLRKMGAGIAAAALTFVLACSARATIVDIGPPVENGSWNQAFQENGIYGGKLQTFNMMTASIVFGNPFQNPGITADSSWTSSNSGDNKYASITRLTPVSPTPSALFFFTDWFASDTGTKPPFKIDQRIWLNSKLVGEQTSEWTGSGWIFQEVAVPIPEPTTIIAGALLLLPIGVSALRALRKNRMA